MITIRKLGSSDYDAFYAMRIHMLESSTKNYTAGAGDWKNASKEQVMAYLQESEKGSDNFVLGAFQDELVGMIGFRRETRATIRHKGSIWGFFVNPKFEEDEVEEALLKEVIKVVSTYDDFEYIRTVQNTSSQEKLAMFLSVGFKQYGLEERSMKVGDEYFDQTYLKFVI
jgi:ribosomal protein S18 acetylase RimI-like enzyme